MDSNSLSVILPAYNEQGSIADTVRAIHVYLQKSSHFDEFEIIVVNDGSSDGTANALSRLKDIENLKTVTHTRNLGYGRAMDSGIREARFGWLLMMDADGQFRIESLDDAIPFMDEFDIISGYRMHRADPAFRVWLGNAYTAIACMLFGLSSKDINCGFKLLKKETVCLDGSRYHAGVFYTNILVRAKALGYRLKDFPVNHYPRTNGKQTGAGMNVILNAVMDLIKLTFSRNQRTAD